MAAKPIIVAFEMCAVVMATPRVVGAFESESRCDFGGVSGLSAMKCVPAAQDGGLGGALGPPAASVHRVSRPDPELPVSGDR